MAVTVLGNFDVVNLDVIPDFTKPGMWYEFYTGDSLNVTDPAATIALKAGEYRLYTTAKLPKPYFTGIDETFLDQMSGNRNVLVFPNPSDRLFTFLVKVPKQSSLEVAVFNFLGTKILHYSPGIMNQGINTFTLDMASVTGSKISAGVYFYRLTAGNFSESGKLIVK